MSICAAASSNERPCACSASGPGLQVAHVILEIVDALLLLERVPVPRQHPVELQTLQVLERVVPFFEIAVAHVREPGNEQVASDQNAFLGQVDHDVAARVPPAEEKQSDLAFTAEERHPLRQRPCLVPSGPARPDPRGSSPERRAGSRARDGRTRCPCAAPRLPAPRSDSERLPTNSS